MLHLKTVFKGATNSLGCLITACSRLSPPIHHLCQNRGKKQTVPIRSGPGSRHSFLVFSFCHTSSSWHNLPFTLSLPFCTWSYFASQRTISPLPPFCSIYHSPLCIFLQTNKLGCCLAVIAGPLYR